MDLTLKDIPEECIEDVKYMALVAVERHLRKSIEPDVLKQAKYESDLKSIRSANGCQDTETKV